MTKDAYGKVYIIYKCIKSKKNKKINFPFNSLFLQEVID